MHNSLSTTLLPNIACCFVIDTLVMLLMSLCNFFAQWCTKLRWKLIHHNNLSHVWQIQSPHPYAMERSLWWRYNINAIVLCAFVWINVCKKFKKRLNTQVWFLHVCLQLFFCSNCPNLVDLPCSLPLWKLCFPLWTSCTFEW